MQSAQWRARDVARKNDLAQIQTAIITSQQDRGSFPWMDTGATGGISVNKIEELLKTAGMTQVPSDPNGSNVVKWLWDAVWTWEYIYLVTKRNGVNNAWFALMAKTEVEWWSNWVTCQNATTIQSWHIAAEQDLKEITTCTSLTQWSGCGINSWNCIYNQVADLRYLLVY